MVNAWNVKTCKDTFKHKKTAAECTGAVFENGFLLPFSYFCLLKYYFVNIHIIGSFNTQEVYA